MHPSDHLELLLSLADSWRDPYQDSIQRPEPENQVNTITQVLVWEKKQRPAGGRSADSAAFNPFISEFYGLPVRERVVGLFPPPT